MLRYSGSLWRFLVKCEGIAKRNEKAVRFPHGTVVVADGPSAKTLLTTDRKQYSEQSGFLRLGPVALSREQRTTIVRRFLAALDANDFQATFDIDSELEALGAFDRQGLTHQGWGVRLIRRYFASVMASERDGRFQQLVDAYVEGSVIPDDIEGRRRLRGHAVVEPMRAELAGLFASEQIVRENPIDLVDAVCFGLDELTHRNRAELYQRLILSLVGFTGVTLEWAILLAGQHGKPSPTADAVHAHVLETLRLYPTAWRLVREVREPYSLDSLSLDRGDQVLVAVNAIHRDPSVWNCPVRFDPTRWTAPTAEQRDSFLPFGHGAEMCPASRFALDAIEHCAGEIFMRYEIDRPMRPSRRPHALTLLAPPRGSTRLKRHTHPRLEQTHHVTSA